ncbi:MAG: LysR family transcriptional regulator [Myxococcota bacterium]
MAEDNPSAPDIPWQDLRVFLFVARERSMAAAARALGVSQTTVARRMESLQEEVGQLFEREGTRLELTPLAEEILRYAEAVDENVEAIRRCASQAKLDDVCIATTLGLGVHVLAPALPRLREAVPEVQLTIRTGLRQADVIHREADIALRAGSPGDERLVGRRIGSFACGLYASAGYLAEHGEPASLEALGEHAVVGSDGALGRVKQAARLAEFTSPERVGTRSDNATLQIAMVAQGLGVATLPCFMADPELRRVLRSEFDVHIDLWLLVNPALKRRPAIRRLIDAVQAEVAAAAPRLRGDE